MTSLPELGVGLGYRWELHDQILEHRDRIDFLEVVSEQCLHATPDRLEEALALAERFPLVLHGVGMSIGTALPLSDDYVRRLAAVVKAVEPHWYSDHLSFSKVAETDVGQLTPVWFTEESVEAVCRNVGILKQHIDASFLLENITYYFPIPGAEMSEAEFFARVLDAADCGMLLDVNNLHINSCNLGYDPYEFLESIPLDRVVQVHIAGGRAVDGMIVDTHSSPVEPAVWDLLAWVVDRASVKGVLLEWDQDFPDFSVLLEHLDRARSILTARSPLAAGSGRT
jgi:hypothetical protein